MPAKLINRLLIVMDAAADSAPAVDYALDLARKLPCSIIAAYVIDTAMISNLIKLHFLIEDEREALFDDLEQQGNRQLSQIKESCQRKKIEIVDLVQCRGRFYMAVLQAIKQYHVDAIVIGNWKDSSRHKDYASIERQLILDQATCPVFIIKD